MGIYINFYEYYHQWCRIEKMLMIKVKSEELSTNVKLWLVKKLKKDGFENSRFAANIHANLKRKFYKVNGIQAGPVVTSDTLFSVTVDTSKGVVYSKHILLVPDATRSPDYIYDQQRVLFSKAESCCTTMGKHMCDFIYITRIDWYKEGYHWSFNYCIIWYRHTTIMVKISTMPSAWMKNVRTIFST